MKTSGDVFWAVYEAVYWDLRTAVGLAVYRAVNWDVHEAVRQAVRQAVVNDPLHPALPDFLTATDQETLCG